MSIVKKDSQVLKELDSVQVSAEFTIIDRETARNRKLNKFYLGVECNNGHLSQRYVNDGKCVQCVSDRNYKRYSVEERRERHLRYYNENAHKVKEYQLKNREHILNQKKEYRLKNRDEINRKKRDWNKVNKKHMQNYKECNKENIRQVNAVYYQSNKTRINKRVKQYNRENPLAQFTRSTIRRLEIAKSENRVTKYQELLGYTQEDFIKHITSKFKKGMSWENRSEWHIDHIKPISAFIKEGVTDIKVINALSNLQPLWALENLEKYNKWQ